MTLHLHPALGFFCYHKVKCNIIKNRGCTLMSALDHEHLDAQMNAQSGTCIHMHRDTRVSGAVLEASQCCFVIESSLLWQTHCLFNPPFFFSLFPSFLLFFSFSHLNVAVYLTLLHWQLRYCLSLCSNYLLHQQRVSSGTVPTAVESAVDWRESMMDQRGIRDYHIS